MTQRFPGKPWILAGLVLYLAVLLALTLMPPYYGTTHRLRLMPFVSIARDIRQGGLPFLINILGNVVAFLPLGVLLPGYTRRLRSAGAVLLAGALTSTAIETLQLLYTRRIADVDDVLLNTLGAGVGYLCFLLIAGAARAGRAER